MIEHDRINNTLGKMAYYLGNHESICVGVSGGSDSNIIVHMIATYFREHLSKVHFVFEDTGIEYSATHKHLKFMEERYGIKIDRIKPKKGNKIVSVVRREGVPIVSKNFSRIIYGVNKGWNANIKMYNGVYMNGDKLSSFNLKGKQKELADYLIRNEIKASSKCCDLSKKEPNHRYMKEIKADLSISGERMAEGGIRSVRHKSCFESRNDKADKYMPIWFWNDDTKQYYKESEGIRYSDCYEVYGLKRTGCVGCPFSSRAGEELAVMKKYEPGLYKLCMNVFGESYRLMDKFNIHRHKILENEEVNN